METQGAEDKIDHWSFQCRGSSCSSVPGKFQCLEKHQFPCNQLGRKWVVRKCWEHLNWKKIPFLVAHSPILINMSEFPFIVRLKRAALFRIIDFKTVKLLDCVLKWHSYLFFSSIYMVLLKWEFIFSWLMFSLSK